MKRKRTMSKLDIRPVKFKMEVGQIIWVQPRDRRRKPEKWKIVAVTNPTHR